MRRRQVDRGGECSARRGIAVAGDKCDGLRERIGRAEAQQPGGRALVDGRVVVAKRREERALAGRIGELAERPHGRAANCGGVVGGEGCDRACGHGTAEQPRDLGACLAQARIGRGEQLRGAARECGDRRDLGRARDQRIRRGTEHTWILFATDRRDDVHDRGPHAELAERDIRGESEVGGFGLRAELRERRCELVEPEIAGDVCGAPAHGRVVVGEHRRDEPGDRRGIAAIIGAPGELERP